MTERMQLCPLVQGVQFTVLDEGETVRGVILRDALEAFFGADESPQSWLQAYAAHADVIDAAAVVQHRRVPARSLVVLRATRPAGTDLMQAVSL